LNLYLSDNREAWEMQSDGNFLQRQPKSEECCAQQQLINLWRQGMPAG